MFGRQKTFEIWSFHSFGEVEEPTRLFTLVASNAMLG